MTALEDTWILLPSGVISENHFLVSPAIYREPNSGFPRVIVFAI